MIRTALVTTLVLVVVACSGSDSDGPAGRAGAGVEPERSTAGGDRTVSCWAARTQVEAAPIELSDATGEWDLVEPLIGMKAHALAVGHADDDGWPDLFVGTFGDRPERSYRYRGAAGPSPDRLLRGGPNGFVVDRSFRPPAGRTSGAVFADLDADGDSDLAVARNNKEGQSAAGVLVFENRDGRFRLGAELAHGVGARSIGVLDHDRDGQLDLFVSEDHWTGGSSVLLRNQGSLRFDDATEESRLPRGVSGLGVGAHDLTGDGLADLFVAGSNRLFVAQGDGTFREAPAGAFDWHRLDKDDTVAGIAIGDLNRDRRADIVLGHHYTTSVKRGRAVPIRVYLNMGLDRGGMPRFSDVTERSGLPALSNLAPHVEIADMDNDGRPDIVASSSAEGREGPVIFRHHGVVDGVPTFETQHRPGSDHYWVAGATTDVDRDGRLDVLLAEWDAARPSLLLRNTGGGGHWLSVGAPATADWLGATVEVRRHERDGRLPLVGWAQIQVGHGYGSGSTPVVHFGLGDVERVDVTVDPPGREAPIELTGLPVDQHVALPSGC